MLHNDIKEYILWLQETKEKMEDELQQINWTRVQSLEIRVAIGYIRAAINALYLTESKNE